jgi:hypothetical protein
VLGGVFFMSVPNRSGKSRRLCRCRSHAQLQPPDISKFGYFSAQFLPVVSNDLYKKKPKVQMHIRL